MRNNLRTTFSHVKKVNYEKPHSINFTQSPLRLATIQGNARKPKKYTGISKIQIIANVMITNILYFLSSVR